MVVTTQLPLDEYLRWCRVSGQMETTIDVKGRDLRRFLAWLGDDELTPWTVLANMEHLYQMGRSAVTVRNRVKNLKAWCRWMVEWGYLEASPMERIKLPTVRHEGRGFVRSEGFEQLLAHCGDGVRGRRQKAMLWLLATTGMRRGELHALKRADLDWRNGTIRIRKGKGGKERWVPFSLEAQEVVAEYLEHLEDGEALWIGRGGKPISYGYIWIDLNQVVERAGIQIKDVCHVFRRTFAANAVRQAIPRQYVMAVAGWSKPDMLDHYVRGLEAETGEALHAFEGFNPFGK